MRREFFEKRSNLDFWLFWRRSTGTEHLLGKVEADPSLTFVLSKVIQQSNSACDPDQGTKRINTAINEMEIRPNLDFRNKTSLYRGGARG
jgi:hypothetical protein